MAKQTINVGTTANDKKGDSLRAAFQKVNLNFTELYAALGLTDVTLNLGAFTFTGSTMSTDDSTNIAIDRPITVNGEITVDGDITPKTNFGASLGTPTRQFKSLYVSNNTIFIGGFPISVDGSGNLVVNNGAGGGEFSNLKVSDVFEVEGTLEISKNNREGVVALSVTSTLDTGFLGEGQLVFEGNHPTYGIIPSNDDRYSLGNPAFGWSTVYTHSIDFPNGATIRNTAGDAVAFGLNAGETSQGNSAVAFGNSAGQTTQGTSAVAIGGSAGNDTQGTNAVAIGSGAGNDTQGMFAVAIGSGAGEISQGDNAIAIGGVAGQNSQAANSIVINATGALLQNTTASSLVVKPVRGVAGGSLPSGFKPVAYNPTTGEFIYYDL